MATNIFTQIEMPDGSIYDLAGGTSIEANPSETSTDELSSIKIGEIVYDIPDSTGDFDLITKGYKNEGAKSYLINLTYTGGLGYTGNMTYSFKTLLEGVVIDDSQSGIFSDLPLPYIYGDIQFYTTGDYIGIKSLRKGLTYNNNVYNENDTIVGYHYTEWTFGDVLIKNGTPVIESKSGTYYINYDPITGKRLEEKLNEIDESLPFSLAIQDGAYGYIKEEEGKDVFVEFGKSSTPTSTNIGSFITDLELYDSDLYMVCEPTEENKIISMDYYLEYAEWLNKTFGSLTYYGGDGATIGIPNSKYLVPKYSEMNSDFILADTSILAYPYQAFDRTLEKATYQINYSANPRDVDIGYDFKVPMPVNKYSISAANFDGNDANRQPTDWTIEGRNSSNEEWTIIDTQSGITNWSKAETKSFTLDKTYNYKQYRLNAYSSTCLYGAGLGELTFSYDGFLAIRVKEDKSQIINPDFGSSIVPNPDEEVVEDLTKIKINGTTYRIADDSIGKKVWYRFTTQSTGGSDASLNVTCDGVTENYLYSTIKTTPLVIDRVFKLEYGLNGYQWRVICLGDKIFYNDNLMKINTIIKEWSYDETVDFEIYNFTGTVNEIIPNPEDLSTDATELTGLKVNGEDYKITSKSSDSQIYIGDKKPTDNNILIWINTSENYDFTPVIDNTDIWFKDGKFYNVDIYGEPVYWNESSASIALDESTGTIYINKNSLAGAYNQAFIYMNNIISDEIKEKYSGIEVEYFISAIATYGGTYGAKTGFFASKNTYVANEYKYLNTTESITTLQLDFSSIPSGNTRYFGFGGNITGYIKSIKFIKK